MAPATGAQRSVRRRIYCLRQDIVTKGTVVSTPQSIQPEALEGLPRAGDLIESKYEVDGIIGIGGMGAVLAGTHLHLQQPVAIKVLLPSFLQDQGVRGRFLREARSAARLRSDHVTRIHDVGALDNGLPYMVMERLEGTNLEEALDQHGTLGVERAVGYVLQACEAVAEAHAMGIVHRDLKPANLFLASKPNGSVVVKVLDFGISKSVEETSFGADVPALTGPHSLLGSPHYMSPEQIRDSSEVDTRTDVWALGVLLYELLSRRMPFEASSLPHLYACILSEQPVPLSERGLDLPLGLTETILACLEKNPDRRIPDVGVLVERLAPFGPPWARRSIDHVRHALEGRQPTQSIRPPLAPVSSAPTPTNLGIESTIAADPSLLPTKPRSRRGLYAGALTACVALAITVTAAVRAEPVQALLKSRQAERATSMLVGFASAHRSSEAVLKQRLQTAAVETATPQPTPPNTRSEEPSAAQPTPIRSSVSKPRPSSPSSPEVRDLKSITLID